MGENWSIIGHRWATELLQRALDKGQLRHAYLFTGPEGVGKTTLGLSLARALLCEGNKATCRRISSGVHPDVRLIEPEGNLLRVEQIREVIREASRRPLEGQYRVFILTHMERAHPAAANALLKTLEEPPRHVILVLTAPAEDAILPTLTSRCQVLHLRPVPPEEIKRALIDHWGIPEERARLLARLSGGRPGLALRLHQDASFWEEREKLLRTLEGLITHKRRQPRLRLAEEWSRLETSELLRRVKLLERVFRDILMAQIGRGDILYNVDWADHIRAWAKQLAEAHVRAFIQQSVRTELYVQKNVNKRLALDVLFLRLPAAQGEPLRAQSNGGEVDL